MDTRKVFLRGFRGKNSTNISNGLNISLEGKKKMILESEYAGIVSSYEQYINERSNSNVIRLTCQVNTVCSNVLFNRVSEVVKNEGSDKLTFLNYAIVEGKQVNDDISDNVYFKPTTMDFWSGCTMGYVPKIHQIYSLPASADLSEIQMEDAYFINNIATTNGAGNHITNAIRDTQLSSDGFVYHCGLDFFNNHLLRNNTFKTICKIGYDYSVIRNYTAFNTIADLMRDVNGDCVVEKNYFPANSGIPGNTKTIALHLYTNDDIDSFDETVKKKCVSKYNGWLGFYNKSKIKSYNNFTSSTTSTLPIERPIMYMNGGDFVDMYPDRELYSFVPKYNKFRNRLEKNWNYCITYPSSSTTDGFDDIIETSNNSLKTIYFNENTRADNGTSQLIMFSIAKHGLKPGDFVNVYKNYKDESGNTVNEKIIDSAEVKDVADDFIFTLFNPNIKISDTWVEVFDDDDEDDDSFPQIVVDGKVYTRSFFDSGIYVDEEGNNYYVIDTSDGKYINLDEKAQNITFKKVVGGVECSYYVRIFTRVPNFRFASGDTSSEYQITKKEDDDRTKIEKYSSFEYEFESHVSRLAFAKNIYSDDIGEIVFTDDIDISNLKDNLGRELTSLYLTIIKNNSGYKEWYGYDYAKPWSPVEITSENVEFSHCFGKITCGFETSDESINENTINSIKKLSNVGLTYGYNVSNINKDRKYNDDNTIFISENEVSYRHDNNFYGDLCCYDYYNALETPIQPILHRFTSGQRESSVAASGIYFSSFFYDEIGHDDFDADSDFSIVQKSKASCNDKAEGYYYIPHYEIPFKSFGKLQTVIPDLLTIRSITSSSGNIKRIHSLEYHFLSPGDKALLYDMENDKYYYLTTVANPKSNDNVFYCEVYDENGKESSSLIMDYSQDVDDNEHYRLFKLDNLTVPVDGALLKDGSCTLVWRNVIGNGLDGSDPNVEVYPFTNGAFYINKRVDLYVRRQDPQSFYGLYAEDDIFGEDIMIEDENNFVEEEEITC